MNDFRLSTFKGDLTSRGLTNEEYTKLLSAPVELPQANDVVYLILAENKELLVKSLKEASEIVGLHYSTLSKLIERNSSKEIKHKNYTVKRIPVFCKASV